METQTGYVTEEEFLARYGPDDRVELVDGEVIPKYGIDGPMAPTSSGHGRVVMNLLVALAPYVRARALGEVYTDPAAFVLSEHPLRRRCPDVAFLAAERMPEFVGMDETLRLAPDLVAEVISPTDSSSAVDAKVDQYPEAGVRLVWKIDPQRRVVTVYIGTSTMARLRDGDALDGHDVVPGFALTPRELFAGVPAR